MRKQRKSVLIASTVLAISSSLCCITPVLALISGVSGVAATFSWLEPVRPVLIGITIFVLAFAWFQKLKPQKKEEINCECEAEEKSSFWQSRKFLGVVTILAITLMSFPGFSHIFYHENQSNPSIGTGNNKNRQIEFKISGMTCTTCAEHVNYEVGKLRGIIKSNASFEKGSALIEFDESKVGVSDIETAINSTGYLVTGKK